MKGVLAEMTDKSRAPRCENATRHGEDDFLDSVKKSMR
jgi:hypothetical protein